MNRDQAVNGMITIFAAFGGTVLLFSIGLLVLDAAGFFDESGKWPRRTLETITRYETVINGERIQCERREDHVRGTTEVAC